MNTDFVSSHLYLYFIALLVALAALALLIARRRLKREYHLFSNENPIEAFTWALLLGALLCLLAVAWFPYCKQVIDGLGITEGYAGTIVATLFIAPSMMLMVYWRRLDDVRDKVGTGIEMLACDKLTGRIAALFYLEKIAKESTTFFPTVIEILCAHARARDLCFQTERSDEALARKMEIKQCVDIISRLWFYNINKRGVLWNYNASLRPDLKALDLSGIHLRYSNLSDFYLFRSDFSDSNLTVANLCGAYLDEAKFNRTLLDDSCMCNARFNEADMDSASLKRVLLFGARLNRCVHLEQWQLDEALGNESTLIPPDLKMPESWKNRTSADKKCIGYMQCSRKCCCLRSSRITPP